MQTKIVGVGIDTLKVNPKFIGDDGKPLQVQDLPERLDVLFSAWQEQARERCKPVPTTLTFNDARMTMLPNGVPAWKYIVKNNWLNVACGPRMKHSGVAKVTFSSEYLWFTGAIEEALNDVHGFLMDVFDADLYLQGGQIDLCVDLVGLTIPHDWQKVFISHAIGKSLMLESQKDKEHYTGRTLGTINFSGHGNPISCKMYNKTVEIRQRSPHKKWFHDLWKSNGWDGETDVWRIEFSLERECLRDMKLDDVYDVVRNIKRLWVYCTYTWLRMVVPDAANKNRKRWKTTGIWQQVQHAFDDYGCKMVDALGPLVRERKRQANIEQGIAQVAGNITTLAAWLKDELDPDADALDMFTAAYEKAVERWSKQGVDAQTLVREKKKLYHLDA
jgi:hypothetical protein